MFSPQSEQTRSPRVDSIARVGVGRGLKIAVGLGAAAFAWACSNSPGTDRPGGGPPIVNGGGGDINTTTTSTTTSASSSSGSGAGSGSGGAGGGLDCPNTGLGEPNESEVSAFRLKVDAIDDCDGSGDSVSGVIAGPDDVDWFYYEGDDGIGCIVDPTRAVVQSVSGLRLCVFIECLSGTAEFSCPAPSTSATSPEGRPGCCHSADFDITDLNCTGSLDEHAFVYIRLDQPGGAWDTCNAYTLDYHY